MRLRTTCLNCRHKLRVPMKYAGRRVTCPRCGEAVQVPLPARPASEGAALTQGAGVGTVAVQPDRLGMASLAMGLSSVLVLCLPFLSTMAVGVSLVGLLVGLRGLAQVGWRRRCPPVAALSTAGLASNPLAQVQVSYSLLGVGACLVALLLSLWPLILSLTQRPA